MSKATYDQQVEQQAQFLRVDALRMALQHHEHVPTDRDAETVVQTANTFYNFIKGNEK